MSQVISIVSYCAIVFAFLVSSWNPHHQLVQCATIVSSGHADDEIRSTLSSPSSTESIKPSSASFIAPASTKFNAANNLQNQTVKNNVSSTSTTTSTTTTTTDPSILRIPPPKKKNASADDRLKSTEDVPNPTLPSFTTKDDCPDHINGDSITQAVFLQFLTNDCRYDKLTMPNGDEPMTIKIMMDIHHIEAAEHMQFKMHMLLQYRYKDKRLDYRNHSPKRKVIVGEELLRDKIWIPHIIIVNEKDSMVMGNGVKDVYVQISPSGEVIFSHRIQVTVYCWMDLKKFPFDEQTCELMLRSWTYNMTKLKLEWEDKEPVQVASQLHLTEYAFKNTSFYITEHNESLQHGAFVGAYSTLVFQFHLEREIGFYLLDYFIPSVMLVSISWVTFWLQADAAPARVTLGTATMLAFITLAAGQTRSLPKVSYIKASEIWFIACALFIFGSMVEFAFVNIIWRRRSNVELKKVNSKYIFKSTLTPRLARKELQRAGSMRNLQKSHSCSSLEGGGSITSSNNIEKSSTVPSFNNYLTVHSFPSQINLPTITTTEASQDDLIHNSNKNIETISIPVPENPSPTPQSWTTMTPQQISQWIDKRSRICFPLAFVVFNIFYWTFVYLF